MVQELMREAARALTDRQQEYLEAAGAYVGRKVQQEEEGQWWQAYFELPDDPFGGPIDLEANNLYFDDFLPDLKAQLELAGRDPDVHRRLVQDDLLPPGQRGFADMPEFLERWQAEVFFRAGFKDEYDEHTRREIINAFSAIRGKRVTPARLRAIAESVAETDRFAGEVLEEFADDYEGGQQDGSFDDVVAQMDQARADAYRSFEPGAPPPTRSGFEFLGRRRRRRR